MATETKEYNCPAEGCEYSGTENSVAAHYSGTRKKPDHAGGYERAKQRMGSGEAKETEDTDSDNSTSDGESTSSSNQTNRSDTGNHPTFGTGDTPATEENETKEVDLPCGCESFSTSDCPEPPFWVTCDTCGQSFKVTEL